jgi:phospholipid/cholesterol/gamma-HCH transport system substrate-binding protein
VPDVSAVADPAVKNLVQPLRDAQPLVPQVGAALSDAQTLLFGLSPYAADAGMFFSHHDLLSGTLGPGKHYFAAMLTAAGLWSVNGLPDPTWVSEPYPDPGTSQNTSTVTGGQR